jgi:tellurite methyltransferase
MPVSPAEDAEKWNSRYREKKRYSFERPRAFLVENSHLLPTSGLAFDAAMGLGSNAGLLLERGLKVIGVDISEVGVRQAKAKFPDLMAVVADLEKFNLPPASFDVILNFFYLQRDLFPVFLDALKEGGILIIETLTESMCEIQPGIDPAYLLAHGELYGAFQDLEVLVYKEGWEEDDRGHRRATAGAIVRKSKESSR